MVNFLAFDGAMLPPFEQLHFMEFVGVQAGEPHWHSVNQIVFVLDGTFAFDKLGGERLLLRPGDVAIIPPRMPHIWSMPEGARCELLEAMYLPISAEHYGDIARIAGDPEEPDWRQFALGMDVLEPIVPRIRAECTNMQSGSAGILYGLMVALLGYVARHCTRDEDRLAEDPVHYPIRAALNYIEKHYREQISVPELANETHLGVSRFSQLFREVTGMAPGRYIDYYRLKKAESLLLYSPLRISQIAHYLGYASEYYFSRAFKKHAGHPPSVFRTFKGATDAEKRTIIIDPVVRAATARAEKRQKNR